MPEDLVKQKKFITFKELKLKLRGCGLPGTTDSTDEAIFRGIGKNILSVKFCDLLVYLLFLLAVRQYSRNDVCDRPIGWFHGAVAIIVTQTINE